MKIPKRFIAMGNRHAARLLGKLEQVHDLSDLAVDAIQREMHYLVKDVVEDKPYKASNKEEVDGS